MIPLCAGEQPMLRQPASMSDDITALGKLPAIARPACSAGHVTSTRQPHAPLRTVLKVDSLLLFLHPAAYNIPPISIALGAAYFQRLLARCADMRVRGRFGSMGSAPRVSVQLVVGGNVGK